MNLLDFGAVGDGKTLCTAAVQQAIDAAAAARETLLFPAGEYLCGSLYLRSYTSIKLEAGAVLKASPDIADYPDDTHHQRYLGEWVMDRCFIFAQNAEHISIEGPGEINGNAVAFSKADAPRPMLLRFLECSHIALSNLYLQDPASWCGAFLCCEDIRIQGLDLFSRTNAGNGDGLDFDCCHRVAITNCLMNTSDDCICLQNSFPGRTCTDVVVTNCVMSGKWAGMRIGMAACGEISRVTVSNCTFTDMDCSALKIQSTEGGTFKDMIFSNLVMKNVPRPAFITLNRFRLSEGFLETCQTGYIHSMIFQNILATCDKDYPCDSNYGIVVLGDTHRDIENLLFKDIYLSLPGGETAPAIPFPEIDNTRPEYWAFDGLLPAAAITLNHVENIRFENVNVSLASPDERPAVVCLSGNYLWNGNEKKN